MSKRLTTCISVRHTFNLNVYFFVYMMDPVAFIVVSFFLLLDSTVTSFYVCVCLVHLGKKNILTIASVLLVNLHVRIY